MRQKRGFKNAVTRTDARYRQTALKLYVNAIGLFASGRISEGLSGLRKVVHAATTFRELARETGITEATLRSLISRRGKPSKQELDTILEVIAGILGSGSARNSKVTEFSPDQIAENNRMWNELEADRRRRQEEERRANLEEAQRRISHAAIEDGLDNLQSDVIPARWWWLHSEDQWQKFRDDPWAQSYELLRRIPEPRLGLAGSILGPHYSPLSPKRDPVFRPWPNLSTGEQERFKFHFVELLGHLGFPVGGAVLAGNRAIIFNCRWPGKRLIAFVKWALENPAPLGVGSKEALIRKRVPPNQDSVHDETYIRSKDSFAAWSLLDENKSDWIYLPVPSMVIDRRGNDRAPNDGEILKAFATFIRKPPDDFVAYRARLQQQKERLNHPRPRTLALGLMAHDYTALAGGRITELAIWLGSRDPAALRRFELASSKKHKGRQKAFDDLDYAKDRLRILLKNAADRPDW